MTAIFTDGSRAQGELLIGADGINSVVRQQLIPELTTLVDAAPRNQLGYSRPVPTQGGGGYSSNPRTRELLKH